MGGASVAAKVKKGLRKANAATGENPNPIYKEVKVLTGGDGITPPTETITDAPLVDAIFQSYDQKNIDGTLIQAGDRLIVCNGDVELAANDFIKEAGVRYMVVTSEVIKPAGVVLAVKAFVRRQ